MSDDFDSNEGTLVLSDDDKLMAMASHVLPLVLALTGLSIFGLSIVVPLIIMLTKGKTSEFVHYHAMQSLVFNVVTTIGSIVIVVATCGFGVILVLPLIFVFLALQIYVGVQAYDGKWIGYPLMDSVGRK